MAFYNVIKGCYLPDCQIMENKVGMYNSLVIGSQFNTDIYISNNIKKDWINKPLNLYAKNQTIGK